MSTEWKTIASCRWGDEADRAAFLACCAANGVREPFGVGDDVDIRLQERDGSLRLSLSCLVIGTPFESPPSIRVVVDAK